MRQTMVWYWMRRESTLGHQQHSQQGVIEFGPTYWLCSGRCPAATFRAAASRSGDSAARLGWTHPASYRARPPASHYFRRPGC